MAVTFHAENISFPKIKKRTTTKWIKSIADKYGKQVGDIGYLFCTDEKILEVNNQFLNHNFYTDIITFDYSESNIISGDIYISLDTVLSNSQKYQTPYDEELHRVIIHGILHLCGLKDKSEDEIKEMRKAEEEALSMLDL
jgi:probable rRNA maturation factor